jgi:hypothetical protein
VIKLLLPKQKNISSDIRILKESVSTFPILTNKRVRDENGNWKTSGSHNPPHSPPTAI